MAQFYWVHLCLFFYAIATLFYLAKLVFRPKVILALGKRFLILAFLLQSIALGIQFYQNGLPFFQNSAEAYFFSAWVLAALFLAITNKLPFDFSGCVFLPAILVLSLFAHFNSQDYGLKTTLLQSPWASIHMVFAFLAFSIFFLCFIMGILFLFQEYQLKHKRILAEKLPSLEVLDKLHLRALTVGFALLTLGIISGSAWAKSVKGVYFFDDPRQLWTLIAWLLYAIFFQLRFTAAWRGKRSIFLSLLGFVVILFTFLEVQHS